MIHLDKQNAVRQRHTIVLVGFADEAATLLRHTTSDGYLHDLVNFDNSFKAFRWLSERGGATQAPIAVVCEASFLQKENLQFLKSMQQQGAKFRHYPIIVVDSYGTCSEVKAFLKAGADDCYKQPLHWERIFKRIDFLLQYKPALQESYQDDTLIAPQQFTVSTGKRIFDIVFATAALLALSPLFFIVALLLKLESSGPIFYFSKRVGTGYRVFNFYKFRSMYVGADARLMQLAGMNQYGSSAGGALFVKIKGDPRITRVGRLIRKTSIDELPQLINVLRGEMSIVGNRPLPVYEAEKLTQDEWSTRFLAPAGLTGLWQVTKRGKDDMSVEERINLDIEYARNWSLWYDIKILLKTIPAMIQKEDV